MESSVNPAGKTDGPHIALVGGGPSALVLAIALARRGIRTTVFERDAHPEVAPRFNPDRSYTIDISGHGLRALRHIDACSYFDDRMIRFKGLQLPNGAKDEWTCRVGQVHGATSCGRSWRSPRISTRSGCGSGSNPLSRLPSWAVRSPVLCRGRDQGRSRRRHVALVLRRRHQEKAGVRFSGRRARLLPRARSACPGAHE